MNVLVRSRHDPSIIGVVTPSTRTGIKIKCSDTPWKGEAGVGTIFGFSERNWVEAQDEEAELHFLRFVASGQKPHHYRG